MVYVDPMIKKNTMKRILLLLALLLPAAAGAQVLSDSAKASVLTCGPGNDFYTSFGHSAIRIVDPASGLDLVYNYGTFDFSTPHFYWKFMRGQLDYQLSRTTYAEFIDEYTWYGRPVSEQPLTFEAGQVRNLFLLLETNYQPEYRYYRYDFLRDNCATRVRDIVYSAWAQDTVLQRSAEPRSYRQLLATCLKDSMEWWRLGIDLLFGLPTDHRCTAPERMFLPAEMEAELAQCTTSGAWSAPAIVGPSHPVLTKGRTPLKASFPPVVAFALLLAVVAVLTACGRRFGIPPLVFRIVDRLLFVVAGLCGLFLCFMWFGTDHWCTQWNLNILWLSPLLILIAIRIERSPRWALWLQEAMFLAAAVWVVWCGLSVAIIPLIIMLMLRVGMLLFSAKR